MNNEYTPSVELALSLATPLPVVTDRDGDDLPAPSGLPEPLCTELREGPDVTLGRVTELEERYPVGGDVSVQVDWLLQRRSDAADPEHLRVVELRVGGERLHLRRGQLPHLKQALEMAEYLFTTLEREELGRRTC